MVKTQRDPSSDSKPTWLQQERADLAVTRILDAVGEAIVEHGVAHVRMQHVAMAASCSRSTLYEYFPTRQALLQAYSNRETLRIDEAIRAGIAGIDDPADALVHGVQLALAEVRRRPAQSLWFVSEAWGAAKSVISADTTVRDAGLIWLGPLLDRAAQRHMLRDGVDHEGAAEWVMRQVVSLLTLPGWSDRTPGQEAQFLRQYLVPALFVVS